MHSAVFPIVSRRRIGSLGFDVSLQLKLIANAYHRSVPFQLARRNEKIVQLDEERRCTSRHIKYLHKDTQLPRDWPRPSQVAPTLSGVAECGTAV